MNLKTALVSFILLTSISNQIKAQDLDFGDVLSGGVEDASTYLEGYIGPFMKGFGYGMSNGWYNTAKPHKPLGFSLTTTVNLAYVPDSDLFFDVENFNSIEVQSGPDEVPTVFGPNASTTLSYNTLSTVEYIDPDPASPTFGQEITSDEFVSGEFDAPDGVDLEEEIGSSFVPVPMVQVGIGLIKNTELKLRFFPTVSTDDFRLKFFGFGVKHDFKQWTPGISHLPFDASFFIGYNKLSAETIFSEGIDASRLPGSNQSAGYDVQTLTFQIIASKKLSVFTLYSGFGFTSTNSTLKMKGNYRVEGESEITLTDGTVRTVDSSFELEEDPIDLDFKSSSPRATIGMMVKLLFLTLHADYTIQKYNVLTAGVGVSIR